MGNASRTIASAAAMPAEHRKVIVASGLGALFEWYDFYLYGALAAILARQFFATLDPRAALVFALLGFAAGFVVRPLGALLFGRLGDMIGRKYTFLFTLLLMGAATFIVGLLPGHEIIGFAAPTALVVLRLLQGLALGGEYGGVVTYVAEHAPPGKRGAYTGWIQTTATLGLLLALLVIAVTRGALGEAAFAEWGWRIPFLLSALLLVIGVWIRLSLKESPPFLRIKQGGGWSRSPLTEAFARWSNLKLVIVALFGLVAGQAVVWYTGQFQALFFLTFHLRVDDTTASLLTAIALALGTPLFVVFGALSDRVGRKPIILTGCLLAALSYFPLFEALTRAANPALADAQHKVSVTLSAPPQECSWQFNPLGVTGTSSACDVARQLLSSRAVHYDRVASAGPTRVTIAGRDVEVAGHDIEIAGDDTSRRLLNEALDAAGYPQRADPARIDRPKVVGIVFLLVLFVTMVYGPIAALLVELFPTRVRCSSVSLPYHIGNGWFGGLLPAITFAIGAQTGDLQSGLWYPVTIALATVVIGALFVPETKDRDIYANEASRGAPL